MPKAKRRWEPPQKKEDTPSLPGRPGYRTRPGRSGYDPLDTYGETGFALGTFIRNLFTGQLRTRNPAYLTVMTVVGIGCLTPLMCSLIELVSTGGIASLFVAVPAGMVGFMLLTNVARNP